MRTPLKFGTRKARFALIGLAVAGLVAIPSAVAAASTGSHSRRAVGGQADHRAGARRLG